MKRLISSLLISAGIVVTVGFQISSCSTSAMNKGVYYDEIEKWRFERIKELMSPDGWLTLIGLYWIQEGENSIGSAKGNMIQFPPNFPPAMGSYLLNENVCKASFLSETEILVDGKSVETCDVKTDRQDGTSMFNWGSYKWHIIERENKYAIRLRDTSLIERITLQTIPYYPIDPKWNIRAKFIPAEKGATVTLKNVVGISTINQLEGHLEFEFGGELHRLMATNGGEDEYFVIIADETTWEETYGGGRYLYVPRANQKGYTYIDFNKAINPPCVFTDYATCPLPHPDNKLSFRVEAGEKDMPH